MDLSKTGYTIDEIKSDGTILVTFDCDGKQQKLSGTSTLTEVAEVAGNLEDVERKAMLDLSGEDFKARMDAYCLAYINGLRSQQVEPPPDITSLIGKKQSIKAE
jgi:hypothetical protein